MNVSKNKLTHLLVIVTAVIVAGNARPLQATSITTSAAPSAQLSTMTIPISIPVSSIGPIIDEIAAKRWNLDYCCVKWGLSLLGGEFKLNGYAERTALEFRGGNNKIIMLTGVSGKIELRHRGVGPFGKTKWTNPTLIGIEANIEGKSQIKIKGNWQLTLPDLKIRADFTKIGPFWGMNLADFEAVNDWIKEQVEQRLERDFKAHIARLDIVKKESKKWWQNLCGSFPIDKNQTESKVPLRLEVKPLAARVTQPEISESDLQLNLGLEFIMRVVDQKTNPQCLFPNKLNLVALDPPSLQFELSVEIQYETLNQILESKEFLTGLNDALASNLAAERTAKKHSAALKTLRISPQKTNLLLEAEVDTQAFDCELCGTAIITLSLLTKLNLESDGQKIVLADIAIDTDSKHALVAAYGELFIEPWLENFLDELNGRVVFDLKPIMEKARKQAIATLDAWEENLKLNNQAKERLQIESQLGDLRLTRLEIGPEHLRLGVSTRGTASITIR